MTVEIICSWCGKEMGEKEGIEGGNTHGICQKCEKEIEQEKKDLQKAEKRGKASQK